MCVDERCLAYFKNEEDLVELQVSAYLEETQRSLNQRPKKKLKIDTLLFKVTGVNFYHKDIEKS